MPTKFQTLPVYGHKLASHFQTIADNYQAVTFSFKFVLRLVFSILRLNYEAKICTGWAQNFNFKHLWTPETNFLNMFKFLSGTHLQNFRGFRLQILLT